MMMKNQAMKENPVKLKAMNELGLYVYLPIALKSFVQLPKFVHVNEVFVPIDPYLSNF